MQFRAVCPARDQANLMLKLALFKGTPQPAQGNLNVTDVYQHHHTIKNAAYLSGVFDLEHSVITNIPKKSTGQLFLFLCIDIL